VSDPTLDNRKVPFVRSLAGRLLLFGVYPAAALVGLVIGINAQERFEDLERLAQEELRREALFIGARIGESNEAAIRAARSIAAQQEAGLFGKRQLTVEVLKGILSADPDITAAYVGYEPGADGNDAAALAADPAEWMDATGRFLPYPFRDWTKGDAISVKPLVDMETSLYYDGVRRAFAENGRATTLVTEPYVYDGQLIVEQSHPIVIDGKFRGIGAVDRALVTIERTVRERTQAIGATAYLVSSRGRFIVATDDAPVGASPNAGASAELRTTPVADSRLAPMIEELRRDADADGFVHRATDPRNGIELVAASVRVPAGDWTLVLVKDREAVVGPIRAQVATGLVIVSLAVLSTIALVGQIAVRTGRRLGAAVKAAAEISRGNLASEVQRCTKQDEAGVLLRGLESMRTALARLIAGVQSAGVTVETSSVELTAASREQAAMAQRFGESTAQVAAASRQITTTSKELARTMSEVERSVGETADLADSSRASLASVDGTIREVAQAADSIAAKLSAISERAASINAVVGVIAKVADQTNLLSVNAAIEAEKAGEQGRGFLVVAREIRRLADQTAGATGDIESIVREMQSAVGAGVMEMDRFAEKVRRGVEEVTDSSRRMGEIIERVEANAERYRAVSEGMQSQAQGADTISASMTALADAARRAVESAEEFGRTADELQRASQTLRGSVGQFTIRPASGASASQNA